VRKLAGGTPRKVTMSRLAPQLLTVIWTGITSRTPGMRRISSSVVFRQPAGRRAEAVLAIDDERGVRACHRVARASACCSDSTTP
jgi:hypothetical protein